MTIPVERKNAVIRTEQLLLDLMDPKITPRIPRELRVRAYHCLRHYPSKLHMDIIAKREDSLSLSTLEIKVFGDGL